MHERTATQVFRVFVSSPGDVCEERELVPEILERINATDGALRGYRLEAFRYEHDVAPKIGPAPQTVVDDETPPYEIYLGLMAARFGSRVRLRHGEGVPRRLRALEVDTTATHLLLLPRQRCPREGARRRSAVPARV